MKKFFCLIFFLLSECSYALTNSITIMTFNIENGGTQINFNSVVQAIKKSGADVVGIQEAWGNADKLAQSLHWRYINRKLHIISRLPLFSFNTHDNFVLIETSPGNVVAMTNVHLPDDPYGPDRINAGEKKEKVLKIEKKTRLAFISTTIQTLLPFIKNNIPLFLTGDFNSPSHLDWTEENTHIKHHRYAFFWPVTAYLQKLGFKDAYRSTHPDQRINPGITWPALRPKALHSYDGFNPNAQDFPDRIDFIFSHGNANATSSHVLGEKGNPNVDMAVSPWPSDHRAVVATFNVNPISLHNITQFWGKSPQLLSNKTNATPSIHVTKKMVLSGEAFRIEWQHAPGYGSDYIQITPENSPQTAWGEAVRLYTRANESGTVEYNEKNKQGNWLAWYKGEKGYWPLHPGVYNIKLMLDDSEQVLAETKIIVRSTIP